MSRSGLAEFVELSNAVSAVDKARAYTREHFQRVDDNTFVGNMKSRDFDSAVDLIVGAMPRLIEEVVELRSLLSRIVGSAYGETTYPGGHTTTSVDARPLNEASKRLGFTRQVGVE